MKRLLVLLLIVLVSPPALAFDPFEAAGIDQRPGATIPLDLAFRDEAGRPVTLRALGAGKPIVLAPVLHNCPNICGVTLSGLAEAIEAQQFRPGTDFALIAFGIDPKEGTAEASASLHELERVFPALAGKAHALTGSAADIAAVTGALGYRYAFDGRIGQYAHVAAVAVLTPQGGLTRWLYGLAPQPTDLKLALTEAGEGRLGDWTDQLLLLCYHYDPQTGRYGPLVFTLLRAAGVLTVGIGAGAIGFAALRERRSRRSGA